MEDKSKNRKNDADAAENRYNPVTPEFTSADDPDFPSNSTTGSGYSEAERREHDGHSPQIPDDATENK